MSKVLGVCTPWECSLQGGGLHLTHLPAQRSLCNERPVQLCTALCWHPRLRRCSLKPTASNVYSAKVPWLDDLSVAASPVVVWLELSPLEKLCPEAAEPAWCSYCRRGRELETRGMAKVSKLRKDLPPQSRIPVRESPPGLQVPSRQQFLDI